MGSGSTNLGIESGSRGWGAAAMAAPAGKSVSTMHAATPTAPRMRRAAVVRRRAACIADLVSAGHRTRARREEPIGGRAPATAAVAAGAPSLDRGLFREVPRGSDLDSLPGPPPT